MKELKKYKLKIFFLIAVLVISFCFSMLFQPFLNQESLDVLVSIYSILAGFLIGVIALIGDPSSLPSGSWRIAEGAVGNIFRKLRSTKYLLQVYMLMLFFVFLYKLIASPEAIEVIKSLSYKVDFLPYFCRIKIFMEKIILFLSFIAFFYSFALPNHLFNIQKKRVEQEIESRREKANIKFRQ